MRTEPGNPEEPGGVHYENQGEQGIVQEQPQSHEQDPESFQLKPKPSPLPDGEPRDLFYETRDESVLSAKLKLWDGWMGEGCWTRR